MSSKLVFLATLGAIFYNLGKYEMTKYYMFVKYENLVNLV
jgi:hypothetical protein